MENQVHILHKSELFEVRDFRCGCTECSVSRLERTENLFIVFVRRGFYEQRGFRNRQEMHAGRLLVTKPGIEYTVRHVDSQPDLCTSLKFQQAFYDQLREDFAEEAGWFFNNADLHSVLLLTNPSIEFLHRQILASIGQAPKLETDTMVVSLVEKVMHTLGNRTLAKPVAERLKKHHLKTIEAAKDYLFMSFAGDVSLAQLADHCCVSVFHLSRIFKEMMSSSPHQFLTEIRLNHAQLLLRSTNLTVTQVAFQSGFNSLEHFATSYRKRFRKAPREERRRVGVE